LSAFSGFLLGFWGLWHLATWWVPKTSARMLVALVAFLLGIAWWMVGIKGIARWSVRDLR